jgi:aspartate/methionine/tyrosine aminotransferase
MSLWTPDGEVPVDRSGAEERPATSASEMLGGPNLDDLSPEERALAEERVAFVPGAPFFANNPDASAIRLSFATADVAKIQEGIARLGQAI